MTAFDRSLRSGFALLQGKRDGDSMPALREAAFKRYLELGLPGPSDENWKYTSLAALAEMEFAPPAPGGEIPQELLQGWDVHAPGLVRLVFADGRYRPELSSPLATSSGILVASLRSALSEHDALVGRDLGRHADFRKGAFAALNTAFIEDGAFIHLPPEAVLEGPIHLLFVSTAATKPTFAHPRTLIVAGARSQATVIETYAGVPGRSYFTNAVTEVALGPGARLEHYKLQRESERGFHVALTQVTQARDSVFASHAVALGGALGRNEVRALFADEGGDCTLNGLYMGRGAQHLDNRTFIDHKSARCSSRELYKGVLDGAARGVFGGRILVREGAQKTDARQVNKNLLLSKDALVDTKPQLEIFADDVKCAHGAAVGELEEEALFYLRSRGLSREAARSMLTYAFASEMVDAIPLQPLRARVRELVTSRLPEGHKEAA